MGEQERGLNSMKAKFGFRKRVKTYIICLVLLFVGVLGSIFISEEDYGNWKFKIRQIDIDKILEYFDIKTNTAPNTSEGILTVFEIDVAQGKSIFARSEGHALLIDAGDVEYGARVVDFLKQKKQDKLDYLIITHPHNDHIGGAAEVIKNFKVGEVLMPEINKDIIPTTPTYEKFLNVLLNKKVKLRCVGKDEEFKLGLAEIKIFSGLNKNANNLNNTSLVTKISYNKWSFLSTGDIEKTAEKDLIKDDSSLKSNVLDIAHHGSRTSTTPEFLKAVQPDIAFISVGFNEYGHPSQKVLNRLSKNNVKYFSTQKDGTLQLNIYKDYYTVLNSHGKELFKKAA